MIIQDLLELYAHSPQASSLVQALGQEQLKNIFLEGLSASAPAVLFASVARRTHQPFFFILPDADEAGYFYHDLSQMLGQDNVFFFPSSYRRQIKYGQRDSANEILRTEVLTQLGQRRKLDSPSLCVVTHPEAVAELVVSKKQIDERSILLNVCDKQAITPLEKQLKELGFQQTEYVYEPGQFAVRGSIVDAFSFSSEYPFRIDFFGDEIDSIRTFEVESQLSRERKQTISIVPELAAL